MEKSDTNDTASEIYGLWLEIYRLWEESHDPDLILEKNCEEGIRIFSRLLDLIDKESDPHDYCVALRMRAQNYCLINKCDKAVDDLIRERDFNNSRNDHLRSKQCDDLISQIGSWCSEIKSFDTSIQRFFVMKDFINHGKREQKPG